MSAHFTLPAPLAAVLDAIVVPTTAPRPVTADERAQTIRREIAKLESPSGEAPDYRSIADLGVALLRDIGKDLLFAAYTAFAFIKLDALAGVHLGLLALDRLLAVPTLTPARPVQRARALDWYIQRLRPELLALTPQPADAPAVRALPDALRVLRATAQNLLGDDAPGFSSILQAAETLRAELPPDPEPSIDASDEGTSGEISAPTPTVRPEAAVLAPAPTSPEPIASVTAPQGDAASAPPDPLHALRKAAESWLAPVDPCRPCGADPSSNEVFAELRAEIQKQSALVDNAIDWAMVDSRSGELLRNLTKDLRLAAWFTLARHHRAGLPGLALGLVVTAELLHTFGAALHPQQSRARRMTSEWFVGQLAAAVGTLRTALPAVEHATLQAASEHLGAALRVALGNDAPGLRPLRDAIQQIPVEEPPAAPEPPHAVADPAPTNIAPSPRPEPASPAQPPQAQPPPQPSTPQPLPPPNSPPVLVQTAASVTAPADLTQLDRFLDATDDALVQTARTLREAKPADPRAYRLLRIGLWLRMLAPPPAKPDGTTLIPGLPDRDRDTLVNLAAKEQWLDLVHRSENLLRGHRLVLDLHFHTNSGLTALGSEYTPAVTAVRAELCSLLLRFPALATLRDKENRPLAAPDTQRWVAEHVLPRSRATQPSTASADPDPGFWNDLAGRLRGDTRDAALTEAQQRIDHSPSRHLRFTHSVALAEAAATAGEHALAAHLFAGLSLEAERASLDQWDPPLVVRCLAGAARSHHRRGNAAARDAALQRLSHLDAPATAALLAELP